MKRTLTITTTIAVLYAIICPAIAAPRGAGHGKHGHRKTKINKAARAAENAVIREEAILDKQDTHAWKKDPQARDHRHKDLRTYTNHIYKRIVRLLTLGAIEEAAGAQFKARHAAIVAQAKAANQNGLDNTEKQRIRNALDTLNDDINAAITEPEQGDKRTPVVNRAQHRFEQKIAFGIRSGRLSTLEASSLRRKVAKLEKLEDRLKAGEKLTRNERERLMKEVIELNRDIKKELRD